jgi:DNA recombination protein RmuC
MEPLLLVGLVVLIAMLYRQSRALAPIRGGDMQLVLQNMLGMMQAQQTVMTSVHVEVGRVAERVNAMDQTHAQVGQGLQAIQSAMQQELTQARLGLTDLQAQAQAPVELEYRTAESVRRLEGVIAGTQSKGLAGENILEVVFSQLPPEWQLRDFKVKNKTVEVALRQPNNLILPIDCKCPATSAPAVMGREGRVRGPRREGVGAHGSYTEALRAMGNHGSLA